MARIVDTLVSIPGYLAVRCSFRISGLLRPGDLPNSFFLITAGWIVRFRRSAMRRCVDVDLCHRRLLDRRDNFRGTFTLPTPVGRAVDFAIPARKQRGADGPAADGGCLNVRPVHS